MTLASQTFHGQSDVEVRSSSARPLLTIVSPSLNQGRFISEALHSIDLPEAEHIVVDGGSNDATLDILEGHPAVQVFRRPGQDSHEAINFGITCARGEIVGVLNTDDYYQPGALATVLHFMRRNPEVQAVCGGVRFFGDAPNYHAHQRSHLSGRDMTIEVTFGAPAFNSWFFRRPLIERLHGLQTKYHFSADRDFLLRVLANTVPAVLPGPLYHYRVHSTSRTMRPDGANRRAIAAEHVRMAEEHIALGFHAPDTIRCLRAWWAYETAKLCWFSAGSGDFILRRDWLRVPWLSLPRALLLRRQLPG